MFELGVRLKEARLRRSRELEQVEEQTRISRRYLRALEDERFELLPGDAYAKAFLRCYADFLGLDAKLYVDEYTARFAQRAPEPALGSAPARRRRRRLHPLLAVRLWPLLAAAAAVAALAVLAWQFGGGGSQPRQTSRPARVHPATRPAAPKARLTPHPKQQPIAVLSLKAARGRCWIDVHLDSATGRVVYIGTLAQGTTIRFSLRQPLWIRFGDPSSVDASIGDKPVTDLPTQAASLIVTKTGIRTG